ncbi:MAG: hypothetical protein PHS37_05720, partial [Candidatus Omnitrophica bacterium]|nr:hypothetical protein [Candidatus Omnitrophota bacterium]
MSIMFIPAQNNSLRLYKKILIGIVAGAFLLNSTVSSALAPESRLDRTTFRQEFEKGYKILSHAAVNDYIRSQIVSAGGFGELRQRPDKVRVGPEKVDIIVAAIPGLFAKCGQFAHVGLGKWNGKPVIYIDAKFYYDEATVREEGPRIIAHEKEEIIRYYGRSRAVRIPLRELREQWIIANPEAKRFASASHDEASCAASLDGLFKKYSWSIDWAGLYEAFAAHGYRFDQDDADINIAAHPEEPVVIDERAAVPLSRYAAYRTIFLSEHILENDILDAADDPYRLAEKVRALSGALEPKKVDWLILRQAPLEQSIVELVSNSSDAQTGRRSPIGRFGLGALQMLAFVIDRDNPALGSGAHIIVDTAGAAGMGRRIVFFKNTAGEACFTCQRIPVSGHGTTVRIKFPKGLDPALKEVIIECLHEKLGLFTKMPVWLNEKCINPLDDHLYINGDVIGYDHPEKRIDVRISLDEIVVSDKGSGMSDDVLFNKYLIPRLGENNPFPAGQTDEEIAGDIHVFYKAPLFESKESPCKIVFQVSGVSIQTETVNGYNLPKELIIQLPSSTRLPLARNTIEIDKSTHAAIRILAGKLIEKEYHYQIPLINALMQAARILDAKNKRVDASQPLLDTAKDSLMPFVMNLKRFVLPNDLLFRNVMAPEGTVFLDEALVYHISPEQIPGARDMSDHFEPGTHKKLYTVPFTPGSDLSYVSHGPYIMMNEKIYEKYKDYTLLLNMRLNLPPPTAHAVPPKGRILRHKKERPDEPAYESLDPFLQGYPALGARLSAGQKQWLESFIRGNALNPADCAPLFKVLEAFIASVPEFIRATEAIDWNKVLPFSSGRQEACRRLIARPGNVLMPSAEFLTIHGTFFLNREHPERLERYFSNLLFSSPLAGLGEGDVIHRFVSQVDAKALPFTDSEMLAYAKEVFANKNLESYESCFKAINQGLVYVDGDGIKLLIMRWMRIYKNDPQAATGPFYEKMKEEYARDTGAEERPADLLKKRSMDTADIKKWQHPGFWCDEFSQGVESVSYTTLHYNGKPLFVANSKEAAGLTTFLMFFTEIGRAS